MILDFCPNCLTYSTIDAQGNCIVCQRKRGPTSLNQGTPGPRRQPSQPGNDRPWA